MEDKPYCVMECGEEELEECQKEHSKLRLVDMDGLLRSIQESLSYMDESEKFNVEAPSVQTFSSPLSSVSTTPILPSRPLVILDPATLNQKATRNVCTVSSGKSSTSPFVLSSAPLQRVTSTASSTSNSSSTPIIVSTASLQKIISTASSTSNIPLQTSHPPRFIQLNGPRLRFPASSTPQSNVISTPGLPHIRVLAPRISPPIPTGQTLSPIKPVLQRIVPPSQPPPLCLPATVVLQPPITLGKAAQSPQVPLPVTSSQNQNQDDANSINLQVLLQSSPSVPDPRPSINSGARAPDLPLLPETRQEVRSDAKSRPAPTTRKRTLNESPNSPPKQPSAASPPSVAPTEQQQKPIPEIKPNADLSEKVDLTQDDRVPISNEDRTFPSLLVTARPSLKIFPATLVNNERLIMDNRIRKVMQMSPPNMTEYLLQNRLVKAANFCKLHGKPLKLGMHTDGKRFPATGGYIWMSECCSSENISVFAGSIFDRTLQPPNNVIKLMYHWACNTAVHNVLNWVKVDSYIMKSYYTYFRAICTLAVQRKVPLLGGSFKNIQIGVISIGTYPGVSSKEVKVDILAVMDPETQQIRLKALENFLSDSNKVYESKFRKILEILKEWVHPESIIITDFAVDLALGRQYGFSSLVLSGSRHSASNNFGVMDYLRAKVPTMFKSTLSMLSFPIIQQFLDELVWRETWGPFPSRAYEQLVRDISELTKLPGPDLITKLKTVAASPANDWSCEWIEGASAGNGRIKDDRGTNKENTMKMVLSDKPNDKVITSSGPLGGPKSESKPSPAVGQLVFLETYYYGVIDGNPALQKSSGAFLAECALCKRDFLSASSFSSHLIHHALNDRSSLATLRPEQLSNVCRYCAKTFQDLVSHLKVTHPRDPSRQKFWCKICCKDIETEDRLISHMTYIHQELDMPYKCDICHFQTSIYENAIAHFKDFHDKDCSVQCPYCFKTVRFCNKSGQEFSRNQYYFVQHVQKHSISKLNKSCEKCRLSFTHMATLKQHQEKMHQMSGKFLKNVKRLKISENRMLKMPYPTRPPYPPSLLNEDSFHTLKGKALNSSVVVPEYYSVCACLECDGPMDQKHFSAKMTCTKCRFQSCCANAIREHSVRRHHVVDNPLEQPLRRQILGGSAFLDKKLYCSYCNYSSSNGNKMAAHLSHCGGVAKPKMSTLSPAVHPWEYTTLS